MSAVFIPINYIWEKCMETYEDIKDLPFLSLLSAAPIAVVCAGKNGNIIFWNAGASRIFGYSDSEVIGQPLTVLMPQRYWDDQKLAFESLIKTIDNHPENIAIITSKIIGNVAQLHGLRKDGTEFPCEVSVVVYGASGKVILLGFISDVTGALTMQLVRSMVDNFKTVETTTKKTI